MKKISLFSAILAGSMLFTGCGSIGNSLVGGNGGQLVSGGETGGGANTGALGSLLSGLLGGGSTLSQQSIQGTWTYQQPDCVFESQNLLAQAGGALASNKIEGQLADQLSKIGIKPGACSFTFNADNTYSAVIGGRTINGNYTLDTANKKMTMTYLAGLGTMTPHVSFSAGRLSLLFESDKLLSMVKGVSKIGNSTAMKGLSSLLGQYEGMYIGLQLSK